MNTFSLPTAATAVLLIASTVHAETFIRPAPGQGGSITLGEVAGSGYHTLEKIGFHIVITLTKDESRPVRFEAVLTQDQSITLSAPDKLGSKSDTIKIRREGDTLVVTQTP